MGSGTENKPAPECHCEEHSDAAISTAGDDMNLPNKGYSTTDNAEDAELWTLNPKKLPSFSVPSVLQSRNILFF
jgi:hypothetical protein